MKSKNLVIALLPFCAVQAMAADEMPAICNTAINFAAQTIDLGLSDGSYGNKHDPSVAKLKKDFKTYPISNIKVVDDCMGQPVNPLWCQVAGGAPEVFQADVSVVTPAAKGSPTATMLIGTITVTANRGGCFVDQVERK